jgi:arginine decarboxylase
MEKLTCVEDSTELYGIKSWGQEYFSVSEEGEVLVDIEKPVSLLSLVESAKKKGVSLPILFKFDQIIEDRVSRLYDAFKQAIEEEGYENTYKLAYPIKVNANKRAVTSIQKGSFFDAGLEVGSKSELLAALTVSKKESSFILCNGYKDAKYIELALTEKAKGYRLILVVEKPSELALILEVSAKLQIEPELGFRLKLSSQGKGKWASSGGDFSKFGLSAKEVVQGLRILQAVEKENCLTLLHFHIGSQIASLDCIRNAMKESALLYTEIARLFPSVHLFDVGGGLSVDYDGTASQEESSSNYTFKEYAKVIVETLQKVSKKEKVPSPVIITESGRALMAHHAVLVTEALEVTQRWNIPLLSEPTESIFQRRLLSLHSALREETCIQIFYEAISIRKQAQMVFLQGDSSLTEKGEVDAAYFELVAQICLIAGDLPQDLEEIRGQISDSYLCNFSLFQSLPDTWAIGQICPIMPIHRLGEKPEQKAIIEDLTCDSDGKIDRFVLDKGISPYLPLHSLDGSPYYIGAFLMGAYQEILGNCHNLFGKVNVVHVESSKKQTPVFGDNVADMLSDMGYGEGECHFFAERTTYLEPSS